MEEQGPVSMDHLLEQVMHKDLGRRLQVGQEVTELLMSEERCPDLEQDQAALDRLVDSVASSWVNSSNFKVRRSLGVHSGNRACERRRFAPVLRFLKHLVAGWGRLRSTSLSVDFRASLWLTGGFAPLLVTDWCWMQQHESSAQISQEKAKKTKNKINKRNWRQSYCLFGSAVFLYHL